MITFKEFYTQIESHNKHPKDYNNGKEGWVAGNPRFSGNGGPSSTKPKNEKTSRNKAKIDLKKKVDELD